jgi:ankyrin repeat protein
MYRFLYVIILYTSLNIVTAQGTQQLIIAAKNGDCYTVDQLLILDYDVNQTDKDGVSALMWAAYNGHTAIVKSLLTHKNINVNQADIKGHTALMGAAYNNQIKVTEELLRHKDINVNQTDKDGISALMLAAANGHTSTVERLLAHKDINVNQTNKDGISALMLAAVNGHTSTVEKLLAHKDIKIRQVNKYGLSALLLAQCEKHKQVINKFFKNKRFFGSISRPPFKKSCYLTLTINDHNNAIIKNFISSLFGRSIAVVSSYILKEGLCTFAPHTLHLFASGDWTLFLNKSRTLGVVVPYRIIKDGLYNNYGFKGLKRIKQENVVEELFNLTISSKITSDTLIDDFRRIIDTTNENHPTCFILDGHGFTNYCIADITLTSFGKFLRVLKDIEAEFLLINTCFAGGKNLLFIQKNINELVKQQSLTEKNRGNKFLNNLYIVITCTNEATSNGFPNLHILFNQLTPFFKNREFIKQKYDKQPQATPEQEFDATFTDIIKSSVLTGNASSIASARMPGEHSFFRALNLGGMKIITYEELQSLKNLRSNLLEITIEPNVKYVQIYPCDAADFTFVVEGQEMPAFISKIPGRGSHFLGKIIYTSSEQDIEQAIRNCIKKGFLQLIEENAKINANTCWFINELILKIGQRTIILNKLIIFAGPDTYKWIYKLDGHIYHYHAEHLASQNTNKPFITHEKFVEIDESTFRWKMRDYADNSFASDEALIEATGGNEDRLTAIDAFYTFYDT